LARIERILSALGDDSDARAGDKCTTRRIEKAHFQVTKEKRGGLILGLMLRR
jgi:hypothetical protein